MRKAQARNDLSTCMVTCIPTPTLTRTRTLAHTEKPWRLTNFVRSESSVYILSTLVIWSTWVAVVKRATRLWRHWRAILAAGCSDVSTSEHVMLTPTQLISIVLSRSAMPERSVVARACLSVRLSVTLWWWLSKLTIIGSCSFHRLGI